MRLNKQQNKLEYSATTALDTHQNHSLPKLGTEKTPQWMKTPNLAWSYHSGSGLESIDFQFGSYLTAVSVPQKRIDTTKQTATNILVTKTRTTVK